MRKTAGVGLVHIWRKASVERFRVLMDLPERELVVIFNNTHERRDTAGKGYLIFIYRQYSHLISGNPPLNIARLGVQSALYGAMFTGDTFSKLRGRAPQREG